MPRIRDLKPPPTDVQQAPAPYKLENIPIGPDMHPIPTPDNTPFAPNPYLRCALPSIGPVSPDNLRQFYRPGVAQTRNNPA